MKKILFAVLLLSAIAIQIVSASNYIIVTGNASASSDHDSAQLIANFLQSKGNTVSIVSDINFADNSLSTIISVGGSCVNKISAGLLGLSYPTCGAQFTSSTSVGASHYLLKTFAKSNNRVAILLAGYEAEDTMTDAKFLLNQDVPSLQPGVVNIKITATINVPSPTVPTGNVHQVIINNFEFLPSSLTIKPGDTVVWTNNQTDVPHTVTSDSGSELMSPTITTGQTYSHTFNSQGTFNYHCNIHPMMKANIIVSNAA